MQCAGIDFAQWFRWKQGSSIYMLSRCKENMSLMVCGTLSFDSKDAINAGVLADEPGQPRHLRGYTAAHTLLGRAKRAHL
ncbi:MAG: hypothetical protein IPK32_25430 [Verrucomicrobiaceae bacterium]|nr:hypothetical protein [Verrucomicrobiaceae bacterium]